MSIYKKEIMNKVKISYFKYNKSTKNLFKKIKVKAWTVAKIKIKQRIKYMRHKNQ